MAGKLMALKEKKPVEYIDGVSKGLWVSVLIKSIRLGWPEGCRQAEARLGKSTSKYAALVQIFEDIYPSSDEIADAMYEAANCDWEALCQRETNAGKKLITPMFLEWKAKWKELWKREKTSFLEMAKEELHIPYVSRRMEENLYEWWKFKDRIPSGRMRALDTAPWTGIPLDMADVHTFEGCSSKRFHTILSGSEQGLKMLEAEVAALGWSGVRYKIHSQEVIKVQDRGITSVAVQEYELPAKKEVKFKIKQATLGDW